MKVQEGKGISGECADHEKVIQFMLHQLQLYIAFTDLQFCIRVDFRRDKIQNTK